MELHIDMPAAGSRNRFAALHRQIRAAIIDGRLAAGVRLPTTRALAALLGVSRNTVVAAYEHLASEGYLLSRQRAGTFVAATKPLRSSVTPSARARGPSPGDLPNAWRRVTPWAAEATAAGPRFDFRVGLPDHSQLPWDVWRRLCARAQHDFARAPRAYTDPAGDPLLREAIAGHVSLSRAVACSADDVVITAGAQHAFALLAELLVTPRATVVAVEDPGYAQLRAAMAFRGARLHRVPLDSEGLRVDRLPPQAKVICVTPSHQFPVGTAMSLNRRSQLLEFARRRQAVVIEDDYDGEFRFSGHPLDALHSLDDHGLVFYVGTFSKVMFPALRVGFVVAPAWARERLAAALHVTQGAPPLLTQMALSAFIREGHLAKHVRRMRRVYAGRRDTLLQAIERHSQGLLKPLPSVAGLHISAMLAPQLDMHDVVRAAAAAGVAVDLLDRSGQRRAQYNGLTFGLGLIGDDEVTAGVRLLGKVLANHR
ncbi:PLP-dependent aminotransferase family protein [Polaromonas sp.]|uniref:MocR-like pyridoxine biosynthesis transcription factor PdxR n=1 Tax=Polaromonas sp. TaxID=1869339 RepID=UPI003262DA8E